MRTTEYYIRPVSITVDRTELVPVCFELVEYNYFNGTLKDERVLLYSPHKTILEALVNKVTLSRKNKSNTNEQTYES